MIIDLHIHTRTGSDGAMNVIEVMHEAAKRGLGLMSITDHDSVAAQSDALSLAKETGIKYLTGIELNVSFQMPEGKTVSLDFLGYGYDIHNQALAAKLAQMRAHREWRAREILQNVNITLRSEGIPVLTGTDMDKIQQSVDGAFGRPHLAAYLVKKDIVGNVQQAFDRYLVKCDVPKYPLTLPEASDLIHDAGGILVLAHPNDPNGTSLLKVTADLKTQTQIIKENMLEYIDGVECWHSRHEEAVRNYYYNFTKSLGLISTGGSDCHQKPVLMGTVNVPGFIAEQSRLIALYGGI